jgi:single-stranded DNA-binding protein
MQMLDGRGGMDGGNSQGPSGPSMSQGSGQANSGGSSRAADDFGPPPSDDFDDDIPF